MRTNNKITLRVGSYNIKAGFIMTESWYLRDKYPNVFASVFSISPPIPVEHRHCITILYSFAPGKSSSLNLSPSTILVL